MAYTGKLGKISHDLQISKGKLLYISGDNELIQRIKIALWHYRGEYFLNTDAGVPWYSKIEGRRTNAGNVSSELRRAILKVYGVSRIVSFTSALAKDLSWNVDAKVLTLTGSVVSVSTSSQDGVV